MGGVGGGDPKRSDFVTPERLSKTAVETIDALALTSGTEVYRCHQAARGPWWFTSSLGRFDLAAPLGTLNSAESPTGALRESFGRLLTQGRRLQRSEVGARMLSRLELPDAVRLCDLTSASASANGVLANELTSAGTGYSRFQSLATSIHAAGRDGIVSFLRFSPPGSERGFYVFGPAGAPATTGATSALDIEAELVALGFDIVDPPSAASLTIS